MRGAESFLRTSSQTRTVIRQVTCPHGYCLLIDSDEETTALISRLLERGGIEAKRAGTIDDAIGILHEEAGSVICAVIAGAVNGMGSGADVIREIERNHSEVPYVVYTEDVKAASRLASHFPRANVVIRGKDTKRLVEALGLKA